MVPTVKRVYVSGPMTGYPDHNFPAFNEATEELQSLGFEVENPAENGVIPGWSWSDYLRYDLGAMLRCDGILLLDGWEASDGANLEVSVALPLGFKRVYADGEILDLGDSLHY